MRRDPICACSDMGLFTPQMQDDSLTWDICKFNMQESHQSIPSALWLLHFCVLEVVGIYFV